MLDINQIKDIVEQRYPFLMIDRVLEYEKGKRGVGIKNVTINEPFFIGHFPQAPIMPGVLILECLAQLSSIVVGTEKENKENIQSSFYFVSINNARFLKPVVPGDQLVLEIEITQRIKSLFKVKATASVNEEIVAKAELGFTEVKRVNY